ncbi:MAG TPA: hypothetical protein VM509_02165 [Planctomycetota bacterium]|nr:hypothetical protein [Planctomycetota bacterium]
MPRPARPGEVNYHFVDRFTLVHASIGVAYALLGLGFAATVVLAIGWELVENPMKAYLPRLFPHASKDTLRNAVGDTIAVVAGWALTRSLQ